MNGKMSKRLSNAKFIVRVESDKNTKQIKTVSVLNNRTNEYKDEKFIQDRGIPWFLNLDDLKETLTWKLNGDSSTSVSQCQRTIHFLEHFLRILQYVHYPSNQ